MNTNSLLLRRRCQLHNPPPPRSNIEDETRNEDLVWVGIHVAHTYAPMFFIYVINY